MSRNEKICGVMKWNYKLPETKHRFLSDTIGIAKLLQQRMVDDGWIVGIEIRPGKVRALIARYCQDQLCPPVEMDAFADTEPAAIVELFCKIYSITEE